jgi:hypothetical protein
VAVLTGERYQRVLAAAEDGSSAAAAAIVTAYRQWAPRFLAEHANKPALRTLYAWQRAVRCIVR